MPPLDTGKQRASRIPLDYFKRSNGLERGKRMLALLAALATIGGGALLVMSKERQDEWYSPGPVAAVHATWQNDCLACHVPFTPIRDHAVRLLGKDSIHATDQKCQACHSGVEHHSNQLAEEVRSCAGCHHEHRGRDAPLARVADKNCTECHAELVLHVKPETVAARDWVEVTDFERNHPSFAAVNSDPGTIKFSHRRHLRPGLVSDPKDKGALTVGNLNSVDRPRYRLPGQTDSDLVRLNCGSCHRLNSRESVVASIEQPDSERTDQDLLKLIDAMGGSSGDRAPAGLFPPPGLPISAAAVPVRTDGRRMLPIVYQDQCRACHPLTLDPLAVNGPGAALMPHGLKPDAMYQVLRDHFAGQLLAANPPALDRPIPTRPLPGRSPDPDEVRLRQRIDESIVAAAAHIDRVCSKCHEQQLVEVGAGLNPPVLLPEVKPAHIPQVWYKNAEFSHTAHRAVSCLECHARADGPNASESNHDVMIPNRDTCVRCHSRPHETEHGREGGARFDCVECHRYHNGDAPLAGPGADARGAAERKTISGFVQPSSPP